ncbi:MAG: YwiC-like family protein [Burkholderiales bacterium]|nr:YwiC-like family protein [Burkholderiales bacterium]
MNSRFWPREHGAYAELLFPIASGLVLGRPGFVAFGFAIAAVLLFLANEALLVALGFRGGRLREELGAAARRHVAMLVVIAAIVGLGALYLGSPRVRLLALAPVALGAVLVPLVFAKRLKTLGGELLAVAAFAAIHLPVGAASGLEGVALWGPVAVWLASFASGTLAVHAIKARQQRRDPGLTGAARVFSIAVAISAAVAAAASSEWRWLGVAAFVPCAAVAVVNFLPIRTKALKTLGWSLVGANLVALAVLAVAY